TFEQISQWIFIFVCVVPAVVMSARQESSWRPVLCGVLASAIFLAIYGQAEFISGSGDLRGGRYQGIYGSSQVLAFTVSSFLAYVVVAPAGLGAGSRWRRAAVSGPCLVVLILFAWLILAAASRSGMLGAVVAVVSTAAHVEWKNLTMRQREWIRAAGKVLIHLVGFAAIVIVLGRVTSPEVLDV